MKHPTYVYIHRRISKALAPELTDEEAAEAAEEDWAEDLHGAEAEEGMSIEQYADGLFGVADMWTDTVDELEAYCRALVAPGPARAHAHR